MKTYQHSGAGVADRFASKLFGLRDYTHEKDDPDFDDFVEGISLSHDELAAFVAEPELSVPEVKRLFAGRQPARR